MTEQLTAGLWHLKGQRDQLMAMLRLYLVPYPQTMERNELNRQARALLWEIEQHATGKETA